MVKTDTITEKKMIRIESLQAEITTAIPVLKNKLLSISNRFEIAPQVVLTELIKYLGITNKNNQTTSPSYVIDLAWHEFILCTKYYQLFCEKNFGKFIHHTPDTTPNKTAYKRTLAYYLKEYGVPPEKIWTNSPVINWNESSCGACHN